jgi:hypothetical protein
VATVVARDFGVDVLLGNSDGTFQAPWSFAAPLSIEGPAVADFDGDGRPDVALAGITEVGVLRNVTAPGRATSWGPGR